MNGIQRVMAAINGEEKDRLPLSLTLSLYGARLTDCPLKEYYTDSKKYVEGQQKVFDEIGPDIIFGPFALPLYGKAFGSEIKFFDDQAPNLTKPVVKKIEDIKNLDFEKALESVEINYFVQTVKRLSGSLGKDVIIAPIALSPVDLPIMFMGIGDWLDIVLTYPEKAEALIEKTSEFFLKLSDLFFDSGASTIVMPSTFVNPTIITKEIANNFQSVLDNTFAKSKGPLIMHSGGAKMIPFLEIFEEISNVAAFVINSDDKLKTARERLSNGHVIIGNIEGPDMGNLNRDEIIESTKKICASFGKDPNFIFGSSAADISFYTPVENIKIIKETIENIYES